MSSLTAVSILNTCETRFPSNVSQWHTTQFMVGSRRKKSPLSRLIRASCWLSLADRSTFSHRLDIFTSLWFSQRKEWAVVLFTPAEVAFVTNSLLNASRAICWNWSECQFVACVNFALSGQKPLFTPRRSACSFLHSSKHALMSKGPF